MENTQLVISHFHDDLTTEEATAAHRDITEGYTYSIPEITFKVAEFKKFFKELSNRFKDIKKFDYSRNKGSIFLKYNCDEFRMYVRGNSMDSVVSIYTKAEESCSQIWGLYNKHSLIDDSIDMFFHSFFMSGPHLDENMKQIKPDELNYISELYYPYINTDIMFDQFFTGAENILLLVGEPGLGKSKMSTLALKHAFKNPEKLPYDKKKDNPGLDNQFINVAYVKSTDVLVNDGFWRHIEGAQIDLCIIDDLDYMLTKRDAEVSSADDDKKNMFLNQFLSFTDGVEQHKTKFIITTNQNYDNIDSALLRKGRLFDIIELRQLDKEEALKIWKDNALSEEEFEDVFSSHNVLPAELGSEINKRLNNRIKTATKTYLLEDDISKVKKAKRGKNITL